MSEISRDVLKVVKNKTGKQVSEQAIKKIASGVTAGTLKSDAQLRKLILQVSKMANVPVSEATIKEIIRAVKKAGNIGSLEQVIKSMTRK